MITPNIIKTLLFILHFVHENTYAIDFDPFGFFVKYYRTKQILMWGDNTDDLYHVKTLTP